MHDTAVNNIQAARTWMSEILICNWMAGCYLPSCKWGPVGNIYNYQLQFRDTCGDFIGTLLESEAETQRRTKTEQN